MLRKNILGKDIEFEKVNCLEIINDNNFEKKLTEIAENYFKKVMIKFLKSTFLNKAMLSILF